MDIVDSIERYLSGATVNKGVRTRMTRARDEIVRLRAAMQQILDKNGHMADDDNCTVTNIDTRNGGWRTQKKSTER